MSKPLIAIACGGTGGHIFPGVAVAEECVAEGCDVQLLISEKDIDQQATRALPGIDIIALPAIGLTAGRRIEFCRGFVKSFVQSRRLFAKRAPQAVLGMGGFTSAPPILAGKTCGALTFLHESNTIPGRANRWIARFVDFAFVGFPSAASKLDNRNVLTTGTPVRPQFQPTEPTPCRTALGLAPDKPVALIMGGSQGASAINNLVREALPRLTREFPELQYIHLTGLNDFERIRSAYSATACRAVVWPFLTEMELALGAANVTVSRAGASSLAELAAMQVPAILVPYPTATDNHQTYNARALAEVGAAMLLEQSDATPDRLFELVRKILLEQGTHAAMRQELARWHSPRAASQISGKMLDLIKVFGLTVMGVEACAAHAA